ncbi:phage portal protein family protein [Phocaeicola plebeius]|uniref:phage portal protein family protein n=1 Tax=Phocaeicola plebeius TaxID=310297 RepID=UPI003AB80587
MSDTENRLKIELLESIFQTSKKTIQEYIREIQRHCLFKSAYRHLNNGTVLDDRSKLIDLYDACVQQDAHLAGVLETLKSQILGERYMLAKQNEKGRYIKDIEETKKIQGTQFIKIINGIVESKLYGFTGLYIDPTIDPETGKLKRVISLERRNILPDQRRIVQRQGIWTPGWSFDDPLYRDYYILINNEDLGLFSATAPSILAKKFTMANYVNFSHTYGQPIIHGKSESENYSDRSRLANEIASAAQNKVIVTGLNDEIDVKTFTMSNSEHIFTGLINLVDKDVSNLILGSQSVAGEQQAYVGSAKTHENVFRDRIEVYRDYVELVMNEDVVPRLVKIGYIKPGLEFKYAKRVEMSDEDKIKLFQVLGTQWEMDPDAVESEFGVKVKRQINAVQSGVSSGDNGTDNNVVRHLTDEEYFKRYGHYRETKNFLTERGM